MEPFFSIVIPTYNPGSYLTRLLGSINTNKCKDIIEVIISDDCSTESFDDIIKQFNELNIRKITNDKHYGFPRTGRQNGADTANGVWICFSDQDDYFVENAFDDVYKFIKEKNPKNYIISDFIEENAQTGEQIKRDRFQGWTHGKLYEKEFLINYNIRYDNVKYCEDINLSVKMDCILESNNIIPVEYDKNMYIWVRRKDSLADVEYFAASMPEYITGTLGVIVNYMSKCKKNKELMNKFVLKFITAFLHTYFYFQSEILFPRKECMFKSIMTAQKYLNRFKEITGLTNENIIRFVHTDLMTVYNNTRNGDYSQVPFIEKMSFVDWMFYFFE